MEEPGEQCTVVFALIVAKPLPRIFLKQIWTRWPSGRALFFGRLRSLLSPSQLERSKSEFLDEIEKKGLRVFFLVIHSHLNSFALRFLFLRTYAISYSFYSSLTVNYKGERRKPDRKPYPLPYGLRNPYRNLKSNSIALPHSPRVLLLVWMP